MASFIVRVDDVCPTMDWERFERFEHAMGNLPVLIGVVPDCRDEHLQVDAPRDDFWEVVRRLRAGGWAVAQHGYTHVYDSDAPNLLRMANRSEFAGHPVQVQAARLAAGAEIMSHEGVRSSAFMAPGHTFDRATIDALKRTGFTSVTDGYGLWPYRRHGLTFVPQLFSRPLHVGAGLYTVCLHLNGMSAVAVDRLTTSLRGLDIVSFDRATPRRPVIGAAARIATGVALRAARSARRLAANCRCERRTRRIRGRSPNARVHVRGPGPDEERHCRICGTPYRALSRSIYGEVAQTPPSKPCDLRDT